jgi:tetratricopeptide (TPR) repeat protein
LLIAGAFVVLGLWLIPRELQQWRLASAEEKRLNGDLSGALEQLNRDIQRNPRDIELRRRKAQWLQEDKQYQAALDETNQIIAWRPTDVNAYVQRSMILQAMGEHGKAVDDWKLILSFDTVRASRGRAQALNGLAYARSLANIEIDEGLADVDQAMRLVGENYAMLDTRGFLYYRKGDFDRALRRRGSALPSRTDG